MYYLLCCIGVRVCVLLCDSAFGYFVFVFVIALRVIVFDACAVLCLVLIFVCLHGVVIVFLLFG